MSECSNNVFHAYDIYRDLGGLNTDGEGRTEVWPRMVASPISPCKLRAAYHAARGTQAPRDRAVRSRHHSSRLGPVGRNISTDRVAIFDLDEDVFSCDGVLGSEVRDPRVGPTSDKAIRHH
jgi:hypothetical protein